MKLTIQQEEQECHSQHPEIAIDSEENANWLLAKLGNLEAEKARITAQYNAKIIELDRETTRLNHRFGAELELWGKKQLQNSRHLHLLQGTLKYRTVPASIRVADKALASEWASVNSKSLLSIETVYVLDTRAFSLCAKEHYEQTGFILPGAERTEEHETFTIQFGDNK